jgi:CBS domain-containing protein
MLVRECLRNAPVTVPPTCTLEEAARLMREHDVGSLLVVSGEQFLGIVTDRDIVTRGVGDGRGLHAKVSSVMTDAPVTIQGSADIFEAFRAIKDAGVRRLPVLEDSDLAGIITVDDMLISLVLELGAVVSPVAKELAHRQLHTT